LKREYNGNSADIQVHIKIKFELRGYTARNNAGNREDRPNEYVSRQNRQARDRKGPLIVEHAVRLSGNDNLGSYYTPHRNEGHRYRAGCQIFCRIPVKMRHEDRDAVKKCKG